MSAALPAKLPPGDWDDDGPSRRWHLEQIRAPQTWDTLVDSDVTVGSDVTVRIVKPPNIEPHHDLNIARRTVDGRPDTSSSGHDHTTHVAGLACAKADQTGTVGAAAGCPLVGASFHQLSLKRDEAVYQAVISAIPPAPKWSTCR